MVASPSAPSLLAPRPAHATYLETRSFGALDGLRALSILAVLWHHTAGQRAPWSLAQRGFLGVDLFFVISGFLIVTLLLRERARTGGISLRNFYIRRFLRIFPIHYAVLLVLALALFALGPTSASYAPFFHDLPYALTYTANWARMESFLDITWSLSAEEQFYLLWPPLERLAPGIALPALGVLLALSELVHFHVLDGPLALVGFAADEPAMLKQITFTPILLGVLLAHALHAPRSYAAVARWLGARGASVVLLFVVVALASLPADDISGAQRLAIHLAMTAMLAACVVREDHALMRLLRLPPLVRIGVLSYGMYLLHMGVRHGCVKLLDRLGVGSGLVLFLLTLAVTVAVAWLSYTLFEQRFLRLKDRFQR